jgi:hypothetical protein
VVDLVANEDEVIEWTSKDKVAFQASVEVISTSVTVPNSVNPADVKEPEELEKLT